MNNERRKRIKLAIEKLQNLQAQVESIKDEVEDLQGEESAGQLCGMVSMTWPLISTASVTPPMWAA